MSALLLLHVLWLLTPTTTAAPSSKLSFISLDNPSLPFHGFIFDPPSRGYLCKFDNNYNCTLFPADADIATHFNRPYINSDTLIYPWKRVNLAQYLFDFNSTHAQLNLHWHASTDVPHIDEYVLLETKARADMTVIHRLRTSVTQQQQAYLDTNTFIVSVPHLVPYNTLYRYGSLTSIWFASTNDTNDDDVLSDTTSILQIIDYYYANGKATTQDYDDGSNTLVQTTDTTFHCAKTFDRVRCNVQAWTIASCDPAFFYECDEHGAAQALKRCAPYHLTDQRQQTPCSRVAPSKGGWRFVSNDAYYGYNT